MDRALQKEPRRAEAHEAKARIWREWGFPELGLGSAYRAVFFDPRSASAQNTLGTLLDALGHAERASEAYKRALSLDPTAAWALNNLCYSAFRGGHLGEARSWCEKALRISPKLAAAHNNLALTFAADGDLVRARTEFLAAGDPAAAEYNLGIVYLAGQEYAFAADRFEQAIKARPNFGSRQDTCARRSVACSDRRQLTEGLPMNTLQAPPLPAMDMPLAPTTIEESGLSLDLLLQLVLKTLHFAGELTGTELGQRLGLNFSVIEPAVDLLKEQRQVEIAGGAMVGRASYRFRITDAGRVRAALFLESNHYVGVAPVPLEQYRALHGDLPDVRSTQRNARSRTRGVFAPRHQPARARSARPAINAGHSMFVYGPPGNGKTVISQAIRKLLDGEIAIPHAIEVEGSIIRFFDPVNHEPLGDTDERSEHTLDRGSQPDRRWVRCKRPMVMVGGELTLNALELSYSQTTGFYHAPVQAVANGGVLVIDDFGRQHCSPRDLLNRWIVPLESRVDFLTLQSGQKFELPFMVLDHLRDEHQAGGAGGRSVPAADPLQSVRREPDRRRVRSHLRELLPRTRSAIRRAVSSSGCSESITSRERSRCAAANLVILSIRCSRWPIIAASQGTSRGSCSKRRAPVTS